MPPRTVPQRAVAARPAGTRSRPVSTRLYRPSRWHWVLCYGLYALVLYTCYHSFWLWRVTFERVLAVKMRDAEWFPPTYLAATAVMGLVIFSIVVGGESHLRAALSSTYYRPGSYAWRLVWRFMQIGAILAVLVGAAVGLQEWTLRGLA